MSDFIWCDLSALRPKKAAQFYHGVLGWQFDDPSNDYRYAFSDEAPVAAIFDMPPFFRKIKMPSFWMSYIRVDSVSDTVLNAKTAGGKVELEEDFGDGKIALIRDPLGAGFTVYQGGMQAGATGLANAGLRVGHTLHVSSHDAVADFYRATFGWTTSATGEGQWTISDPSGKKISDLKESSDVERGGFEYWGITFAVDDLEQSRRKIESLGGTVFAETPYGDRKAVSAADMDGAAFSVVAK